MVVSKYRRQAKARTHRVVFDAVKNEATWDCLLGGQREVCCVRKERVRPMVVASEIIRPARTLSSYPRLRHDQDLLESSVAELGHGGGSDARGATVGFKCPVDDLEVGVVVPQTNGLDHLAADERVELTLEILGELAIVQQVHADAVRHAGFRSAPLRHRLLLHGERDGVDSRAELRSLDCHRTPARADLKQAVTRLHARVREDVVNLANLRFV